MSESLIPDWVETEEIDDQDISDRLYTLLLRYGESWRNPESPYNPEVVRDQIFELLNLPDPEIEGVE